MQSDNENSLINTVLLSDTLLDTKDAESLIINTPIHEISHETCIPIAELEKYIQSHDTELRHKATLFCSKKIIYNLQNKIEPQLTDQLKDIILRRKSDISKEIRIIVLQTLTQLIIGGFDLCELIFDFLIHDPSLALKSLKDILILNLKRPAKLKNLFSNKVDLLLSAGKSSKNQTHFKKDFINFLFRIYSLGSVNLHQIKEILHLAPPNYKKKIKDDILGNQKLNLENKAQLASIIPLNPNLLIVFGAEEKDFPKIIDYIKQYKPEELIFLKSLTLFVQPSTPIIFFINLIKINKNNPSNIEVIVNSIPSSNLEPKDELFLLLQSINQEINILNLLINLIKKFTELEYLLPKLINQQTASLLIQHFDFEYSGNILFQFYKFIHALINEKEILFNKEFQLIEEMEELMNKTIFLYELANQHCTFERKSLLNNNLIQQEVNLLKNEIKKDLNFMQQSFNETQFHTDILSQASFNSEKKANLLSNTIYIAGPLNEKVNLMLNYLLDYIELHSSSIKPIHVNTYFKLVDKNIINPDLTLLFNNPNHFKLTQPILDLFFLNLKIFPNFNFLGNLKLKKLKIFPHLKQLIDTENEEIIKYFIKQLTISELVYLEGKVKNKELKRICKDRIVKDKRFRDVPIENENLTRI